MNVLIVALGGGLGSAARYAVSRLVPSVAFPFGTFTVNVIGCLLLGVVTGWLDRHSQGGECMRLFLIVGFCGGFTTFSTFVNEGAGLISSSRLLVAALYLAASAAVGFAALIAGLKIGKCL